MISKPNHKWLAFACVALGTFISYLDASIVNIALPTVAHGFGVDVSTIEWVVTSYLLMITSLVIVFGHLADRYGRKRLYAFGFVVFTSGSFLCAAAPSVWSLVAFRCVQGIGGAALLANGTAIVTEAFPFEERGKALGMIGSVLALAAIVGPLLGGFLAAKAGWRSIFYVNLPIGLGGWWLTTKVLPPGRIAERHGRFDTGGSVTLVTALGCLLVLVNILSRPDHSALGSSALLVVVMGLVTLFFVHEQRIEHPLVDLGLFTRRAFSAALGSSYLSFWAMASVSFLLPFYLDVALKLGPGQSGMILAPIPVFLILAAPLGGWLADRLGARLVCTVGAAINCLGLLCLATLGIDTPPLGVVLRLVPLGVGMGLFQPPNSSAIMSAVPVERLGIASGLISGVKNLGSLSGVAVTSLMFAAARSAALAANSTGSVPLELAERLSCASAVRVMYLVSAAIASIAVAASLVRGESETRQA